MLAIGIYVRSQYGATVKTLLTVYLDEALVRQQFLREFGDEPTRIVILQNGANDPHIVRDFCPSADISKTGWGLIWSSIGLMFVSIGLVWILGLNHVFYKYGWICIAIMAIACGLMLYMKRHERKRVLKGDKA